MSIIPTKSFSELFKITKGKKVQETQFSIDTVRYIQIDDLRNDDNIKFCESKSNYVYATASDIIIAWDGANAGTIGYNLEGAIGSTLALVRPMNAQILPSYAAIYLQSKFEEIRSNCTGATIPHVNKQYLQSLDIPVPRHEEQEKIVSVLELIMKLIFKRKEQIMLLNKISKDMFIDMFGDPSTNANGWERHKISEICKKITDGTHQSPKFTNAGIPFLFVSNIRDGEIDYNTKKFITEEEYNLLIKRTPIEIGDILYTIVGSYGNPAVIRKLDRFCFQRHIAYLKPKTDVISPDYLSAAMLTSDFKYQLEQRVKGIAQKTLNLSELKEMVVCLPPLSKQAEYVTFLNMIRLKKSLLNNSLAELEITYKATLQKAFNGELF
ncbi:MAG: restriction endonuclease subunit S [Lachnospiraceae bacterium]